MSELFDSDEMYYTVDRYFVDFSNNKDDFFDYVDGDQNMILYENLPNKANSTTITGINQALSLYDKYVDEYCKKVCIIYILILIIMA